MQREYCADTKSKKSLLYSGIRYLNKSAIATVISLASILGISHAQEPRVQDKKEQAKEGQDLQEKVRQILTEANVQGSEKKKDKIIITLKDGRVLEYSDTPGQFTYIQIFNDGDKIGSIYLADDQKTLEHGGKTVRLADKDYKAWENIVHKFFEGKDLYPREPDTDPKPEPKQDPPKDPPTIDQKILALLNEADVAERTRQGNFIIVKRKDGTSFEYADVPGKATYVVWKNADGSTSAEYCLFDNKFTVEYDGQPAVLTEDNYKALESAVFKFFEQKDLYAKPEPKPEEKPLEEPKQEVEPKQENKPADKIEDTFVKPTGSSLYLPGRLFDNNYARASGGIETKDSGIIGRFDGTLSLGYLDLGWDLLYKKTSLTLDDTDSDTGDISSILAFRHKMIDMRLNAAILNTKLSREFANTVMLSPTLQQDTLGNEDTDISSLLFSGALNYRLNDSLLVQLLGWSDRAKETHELNQTDHVFGTVIVPGFGPVAVDDTVLTEVKTKTITREQGVGMGLDLALGKYAKLAILPVYTKRSIQTTLDGKEILDEDYNNIRAQARFQWDSFVLTCGRLHQFNDDLDSEWIGAGHYSFRLGENVLTQLYGGIDDGGKGFGGFLLNFNATRNLTARDVMAAAAYRNLVLDTAIDWGLTADQRRNALGDARDAFIRSTGGLTIEAWLRDRNGHNIYGAGFGVDLDPLIPSLILLGDFEGSRDYRFWSLGARKRLFGFLGIGASIQSVKDGDRESRQGTLEIIIGGK